MDANQTRLHLLLGQADWARCLLSGNGSKEIFSGNSPVAWAKERQELTLRPKPFYFPSAARNDVPEQSDRRGAAADIHSNWYWIAQSGAEIRIHSSGEQRATHFWSAADAAGAPPPKSEIFQPVTPPAPPCPCAFSGLAITEDSYLVAGAVKPKGLLVFDLLSGGAPRTICWPEEIDFEPFDIVPRRGGGVWILDRKNKRFWGLDRGLRVITRDQATSPLTGAEDEIFLPASETHHARPARSFPRGVELESGSPVEAVDPVAIEALPDGSILILDALAALPTRSRVLRYRFGKAVEKASLEFPAYDFAFAGEKLFIASAEGNQVFAFKLEDLAGPLVLTRSDEFFPLRRFGGKALVAAGDQVYYDFGERWLPVTVQAHPRHAEEATIETRAFDGREPQCVWHRLMLDACLPAGTDVEILSRAADRESELAITPWEPEPRLHRRGDGSELPFAPVPASRDRGTYELLLQKARGRYLQLRLRLVGDGRVTPHLTALRVYYPRFSYLERYLPAVYREDSASAFFLDRFLANIEGTNTAIEDRIAAAQILFDVRSAPPDALEWLASWFGVALDPAWDETRRRLFIAHAMEFFQWRGTVRGLKMALRLALEEHVDDHIFDPPGSACRCGERYRIVEKFLTRGIAAVEVGDPSEATAGPALVSAGETWSPKHGAAALHARSKTATGAESFSLQPYGDADAEAARVAFARRELGFLPSDPTEEIAAWKAARQNPEALLPEDEPSAPEVASSWRAFQASSETQPFGQQRSLWQQFLIRRYVSLAALNQAHGTHWKDFGLAAYPGVLPATTTRLIDWIEFETHVLPTLAAAHRFTVLLPVRPGTNDAVRRRELALASRIVELEKPAHTAFDVKFFWANFRVGEARIGTDTVLGRGGRDPALQSRETILGQSFLSESLLTSGPPPSLPGRIVMGRDPLRRKPHQ
ncbi:MAG TPA: phage tail protein [Chthoniobacterales bacterium]|nr:phage tail protein [Chthoniobacterales bacterium]